jgi:hypothetical protein
MLSSAKPLSLRFLGMGLSSKEHSAPLNTQRTHPSSSSLMTQSSLRRKQASQGWTGWPFTEPESGESKPFRRPGYESRLMLPWRLGGKRGGLGAMAIGAVLGTALGVDMVVMAGIDLGQSRYRGRESEWCSEARPWKRGAAGCCARARNLELTGPGESCQGARCQGVKRPNLEGRPDTIQTLRRRVRGRGGVSWVGGNGATSLLEGFSGRISNPVISLPTMRQDR